MRRILLGFCLLGGALSFSSSPALAQTASTVSLSTGGSCVYTGITVSPNGGLVVTCSGGAATAPGAPTIGAATPGDTSASIAFTAGVAGSTPTTGYTASCSVNGLAPFVGTPGAGAASPLTVTGLANGTAYLCSVTATNITGTSPASGTVSVTPSAPIIVPNAPVIGAATPGNGSASIAFTPPVGGGGGIIDYTATCGAVPVTGAASPITVTPLVNGTPYTCSVTARNAVGSSVPSSTVAVTPAAPTAPGAPTGVTVTPGNGTISVAFTAPASNGGAAITTYNASCTSSDGGAAGTGSGAASPITVSGVTNGKTYTCTVTATNSAGTGAASAASGTTQPVAGCVTPAGTTIGTLKATGTILNQTESGTIPAGAVKAFPFVLQAIDYPYGAKFEIDSGYNSGAYNPKDVSVSSCPGVFTGLAYPCMKTGITANRISTAPVGNATSLCETIPGQTYYLNVRATNPALDAAAMINPMKR